MKKQITFTIMLLLSIVTYSQIKYEKGYFISNDGTKTECLIKNMDWRYNPSEFNYKTNESSQSITASLKNIKEFSVDHAFKYKRFKVKIDRSIQDLQKLTNKRSPEWNQETLFLKQLVSGNIFLYQYKKNGIFKFFYTSDNVNIEQLIYKEYKTVDEQIAKNLTYVNQLFKNINCNNYSIEKLKKINYNQTNLTKYFRQNNLCENPDIKKEEDFIKNKSDFNLRITPGVNFSSLSISNDKVLQNDYDINYGSNVAFRIGIEIEYILPFNKNKWSLFIEPNYSYYKSEIEKEIHSGFINSTRTLHSNVEINSIEIPLGIRHYLFLKNNSKIFINAAINFSLDLDSNISFDLRNDLDDIGSHVFFFGGLGYNLNGKYSIEMRYYSKNVLSNYLYWESDYENFSLIFGYNFL